MTKLQLIFTFGKHVQLKKGAYYMSIKFFNHLPRDIRKLLYDVNKFKVANNKFLRETFYSVNEIKIYLVCRLVTFYTLLSHHLFLPVFYIIL
jgi:hypothetical protein